jgi:hypothetical protein
MGLGAELLFVLNPQLAAAANLFMRVGFFAFMWAIDFLPSVTH